MSASDLSVGSKNTLSGPYMGQSFQFFQRNGVLDAKRPDAQPPQRGDMPDRAEGDGEVARNGADIDALAGLRGELRPVVVEPAFEAQFDHIGRTRGEVGFLVGAGQVVCPLAPDLDRGIARRRLHDPAGEGGQGVADGVVVRANRRWFR